MVTVTIDSTATSAASIANPDLLLIWQSAQNKKITAQALFGSGLTVLTAAGTAGSVGTGVGAATVGLFSGGSGATEYLGLGANGTEFMRSTSALTTMALATTFSATATFSVPFLTPAGTGAAPGAGIGAATVGLFSGGAGATEYLGLAANGTEIIRSTTALTDMTGGSQLSVRRGTSIGLLIGSDSSSNTARTDATNKQARIGAAHYTNSEEPIGILFSVSSSGASALRWGGGSGALNACTSHEFYVASGTATTTGTELLRVTTAGVRIQSGVSAAASDIFHVANTAGTVDILRCSDSLGTVGIGGAPVSGVGLSVTNTGEAARFRYDASNYLTITVSSAGLPTYTAVGSGSRRHTFVSPGATDSGLLTHVVVDSSATLALGVGGAVTMRGAYTGTTRTDFAAIKGYKETATDGETGGHLDLYSRTNGSNLAANLRVAASGSTLSRASITTQTPSASAQFQVDSTTKGFLPPRMTEAQRDAIGTPAAGLIVYNTDTNLLNFYNGSAWGAI